jgi:hypothetical protein
MLRSRLTLDLVSAGLLLLAMGYHWKGNAFHEFVGTGMFGLVVAHNVYNRRWWGALAKPRSVRRGALHTGLALVLLGAMLALLVTSVMISETLLTGFLRLDSFTARQVHGFVGYWVLTLVAVHIGLRWALIMGAIRNFLKVFPQSRPRVVMLRAAAAVILAAGVHSAMALGILPKLMFQTSLDWWNFEESAFGFFAHCMLFASALMVVAHFGSRLARWR